MKALTNLNTILVFQNNELINNIQYRTKTIAKKQYNHFLKYGITNPQTGEKLENVTFELL